MIGVIPIFTWYMITWSIRVRFYKKYLSLKRQEHDQIDSLHFHADYYNWLYSQRDFWTIICDQVWKMFHYNYLNKYKRHRPFHDIMKYTNLRDQ